MLNLKPQQKTPDWPGFSPFFFVFSTLSYLFLLFHEMDGDDETVRCEKEVCTIKKTLFLCTLKLNSILHVETNRFSATFWLYRRALVNVFQFWEKLHKMFFPVCASSTPSETQFSKARKVVNPWRNGLDHKLMQATLCLKSCYLMTELRGFEPVDQ